MDRGAFPMNYNVLRYFSVLAQVEHYTVAAARLGISQPSLSSAIHNLENALGGVKLFEKVGRNIRLTEEGKFYQEKVDAALKKMASKSISLKGLFDFILDYVCKMDSLRKDKVSITEAHYYRGRYRVNDASSKHLLFEERKFEDTLIENKVFAFNTEHAATFTSENNNLITMNNVTFSGRVEQIAMGEYRDKGNYVAFRNEMNNVVAENMVVTHPVGIANVETVDYMAPLFFLRGVTTLNNCKITGTTSVAPQKKDYNGTLHDVMPYDCGVPNGCEAIFNNCEIDKLYAWSHSQITLKDTKMKYIRCSTHHNSEPKAHLTIDAGSVVDEIVVTSTEMAKFKTIEGKKTLTANVWAPSLIIKAGATVKRLDMNGRPSIDKYGNLSVIIEDGATVEEIVNAIDEF
jgi:hypothetical protein